MHPVHRPAVRRPLLPRLAGVLALVASSLPARADALDDIVAAEPKRQHSPAVGIAAHFLPAPGKPAPVTPAHAAPLGLPLFLRGKLNDCQPTLQFVQTAPALRGPVGLPPARRPSRVEPRS